MSRLPKNPAVPRVPLTILPNDIVEYAGPLWRIHTVSGEHPSRFDEFRRYGPVPQCRWDPHPLPAGFHSGHAVLYCAGDAETAFSEDFQSTRVIELSALRYLSGWEPQHPLKLLDLVGTDWALRHGASASLTSAPKSTCRAWARAIHNELGAHIDGIRVPSTMTGAAMAVLFESHATVASFPAAPTFARPLDDPRVGILALKAAARWNWSLS
ncbi:MAG: RES family NAD+ phosphorylase [Galactobacter sp.]